MDKFSESMSAVLKNIAEEELAFSDRMADTIGQSLRAKNVKFDTNALVFKTMLHSMVHYVPRDAIVGGTAALLTLRTNSRLNPRHYWRRPNRAVDNYCKARGLDKADDVTVKNKRRMIVIDLA